MPFHTANNGCQNWRAALVGFVSFFLALFGLAGVASANTYYHAELAAGWVTPPAVNDTTIFPAANGMTKLQINGTGNGGSEGSPVSTVAWTAPAGTHFDGFLYSAANFGAGAADWAPVTGAWSAGIWGWNGSTPIVFPWTHDCSVHGSSSTGGGTQYWTSFANPGIAGSDNGQVGSCSSTGNTTSWAMPNFEDNQSTGASVAEMEYDTLELRDSCDALHCAAYDTARADVNNMSAVVDDPQNQPSLTNESWTGGDATNWYTSTSSSPTLNFTASDPSGICDLRVALTSGASGTQTFGDLAYTPTGTTTPDSTIGTEFSPSTLNSSSPAEPCDSRTSWSWTLPSTLASDTYTTTVQGANAGQYEGANFSSSGDSTLGPATTIHVDNTIPTVAIANDTADSNSAIVTVVAGPSGLTKNSSGKSTIACTENSLLVDATQLSGAASGVGTTTWSVPINTDGTAGIQCVATNNDVNTALASPVATFQSNTYEEGSWSTKTVGVVVTAPAGDTISRCDLDGVTLTSTGTDTFTKYTSSATGLVAISSNGEHTLACYLRANGAQVSATTYAIWIDSGTPAATVSSDIKTVNAPAAVNVSVTDANWTLRNRQGSLVVWLQPAAGGAAFPVSAVSAVSSDQYRIVVPDGAVARGRYQLIADAKDAAGRSSTITLGTLSLPLRSMTNLTVSAGRVAGRQQARTPASVDGVSTSASAALASEAVRTRTLNVRWGQAITLTGRLTHAGKVIAGATVVISQRVLGTTKITTVGTARTSRAGQWSFRVKAGASRDLYATYLGTSDLRSSTAALVESSTAAVSISAGQVRAGGKLRLGGRVFGGHIPAGGLTLVVHSATVGFPGSAVAGFTHVSSSGRWSYSQPFRNGSAGESFQFWVTVRPTGAWPYRAGVSGTVTRKVG